MLCKNKQNKNKQTSKEQPFCIFCLFLSKKEKNKIKEQHQKFIVLCNGI